MARIKNVLDEYVHIIIAALIAMSILMLVYVTFYIYPFGNGSVLVLDLNGQYVSYFEGFRQAFYEGKSLFYSWSTSLGSEMLGLGAYYLFSPFSLIVLLFPVKHITEAILVMSLLKVGMCAITMGYYLHKHQTPKMYTFLFALSYALSSYVVVQAMNIMWLDAVYLLPLLILGVERLVDEKKYLLFCSSLILLFITNYYIAYMVGLFSFLYLIYYLMIKPDLTKKDILTHLSRFFLYTLIAVFICAWLLIPTYYSLTLGKTTFTTPDFTLKSKFDFLDFFVKLLPSTYDSVNIQGLPFVYCGLFAIISLPLYFFNKKISFRNKLATFILLVVVVLCMNISWIDLALHGFQNPNWLNYRYAFVFSFLVIILAARALSALEGISYKHIYSSAFALVVLLLFVQKLNYAFVDDLFTITLSIISILVYAISLVFLKMRPHHTAVFTLIVLLSIELFSSSYTSLKALDKEVLYSNRDSYIPIINDSRIVYEALLAQDEGFYRVEKNYHRTVNDPMSIGMRGISHSTSTLNAKAIKLVNRLGYSADAHWTKYLGGTPISDAILGVKYVMSQTPMNDAYDLALNLNHVNVYQNPNALSIINGVSSDLLSVDMENICLIELQNQILSSMLGLPYTEFFEPINDYALYLENADATSIASHVLYREIDSTLNSQLEFNFNNSNDQSVYLYFPSSYHREVNLWLNSNWIDTYYGNESYRIYDLGILQDDASLVMTIINSEVYLRENVPYFYTFNQTLFDRSMKALQANSLNIHKYSETHLKGDIDISISNPMVYTSIPYIKGWRVYVDGKVVEHYEIMDGLIGFDITNGQHHIVMKYHPYGLNVGLALGVLGIILLIVMQFKDNQKFKEKCISWRKRT